MPVELTLEDRKHYFFREALRLGDIEDLMCRTRQRPQGLSKSSKLPRRSEFQNFQPSESGIQDQRDHVEL